MQENLLKVSSLLLLNADQQILGTATLASSASKGIPDWVTDLDLARARDNSRLESVPFRDLLEMLGLEVGATKEQIMDRLKLVIGRSCSCFSAENVVAIGLCHAFARPARTGLDRVKQAWRGLQDSGGRVATFAAEPSQDQNADGFLSWQELAGIAGHEASETLTEVKAVKFVEDQLNAGGKNLVTFQHLGQLIGTVSTAMKEEIIQRFRELAKVASEPVQTLSAGSTLDTTRFRLVAFGLSRLQANREPELTGSARAARAWAHLEK